MLLFQLQGFFWVLQARALSKQLDTVSMPQPCWPHSLALERTELRFPSALSSADSLSGTGRLNPHANPLTCHRSSPFQNMVDCIAVNHIVYP